MFSFTTMQDGDYEQVLCCTSSIESDYPVWLFIVVLDMHEATGDTSIERYHCSLQCSSPGFAGDANCERARESMGVGCEWWGKLDDMERADILRSYGCSATLWQQSGDNRKQLIRAARKETIGVQVMFGFYADRILNRIGSTGWDFMRGDLDRPIRELSESATDE